MDQNIIILNLSLVREAIVIDSLRCWRGLLYDMVYITIKSRSIEIDYQIKANVLKKTQCTIWTYIASSGSKNLFWMRLRFSADLIEEPKASYQTHMYQLPTKGIANHL